MYINIEKSPVAGIIALEACYILKVYSLGYQKMFKITIAIEVF